MTTYPNFVSEQLRKAAAKRDVAQIDAITDELVRMGLARPRDDGSRFNSRPDAHARFEALMRKEEVAA